MVRKYVRKTHRQAWDPETMHQAQTAISEGMALKTASRKFGIDRMALKRRCNSDLTLSTAKSLGSFKTIFSPEQERELINHFKMVNSQMYGVTKKDVRYIAFHLAEHNNISHNFNNLEGLAGKDWLEGFLRRHPEVCSLLTSCFSEQDKDYHKSMIGKFFRFLREAMTANLYPAYRIFSAGEISFSGSSMKCIKNRAGRVIQPTGSAYECVSSIICMSAGGNFIPPMMIFHRKCMKMEMLSGAPQGTVFACNAYGWVALNVFQAWFEHFLKVTKPTSEDPVLLILDGYLIHTKNIEIILKAKESFVTVIFLPPLLTHKIHPIETSISKPLLTFYEREVEKILKMKMELQGKDCLKSMRREKITPIFSNAYAHATTSNNAVNGFWKCGIYPFDPDIFAEEDIVSEQTSSFPQFSKFILS